MFFIYGPSIVDFGSFGAQGDFLGYAIVLLGRRSGFRSGSRPDSNRESFPARPERQILRFPDLNPAGILPGSPISGPEAPLCNVGWALGPFQIVPLASAWVSSRWSWSLPLLRWTTDGYSHGEITDFLILGGLRGSGGPKSAFRGPPQAPRPARNVSFEGSGVGDHSGAPPGCSETSFQNGSVLLPQTL